MKQKMQPKQQEKSSKKPTNSWREKAKARIAKARAYEREYVKKQENNNQ